jgi:hypothetical protein
MKHSLFLFIGVVLCSSCSTIKESVVDTESGQKVSGYDRDCKLRIGETTKGEISQSDIASFKRDSLVFDFAQNARKEISAVSFSGKYATSKGLKSGDPAEKALKLYGKPKAMELDYGKDEEHRIHWVLHGLFYKKFSVFTDPSFKTVIGITIGKGPDMDKRFVKK